MQRVNHLPRRVISIVLTIVMVASLFSGILPGLGVTAKAAANEIANDSLKISVGDLGQISTLNIVNNPRNRSNREINFVLPNDTRPQNGVQHQWMGDMIFSVRSSADGSFPADNTGFVEVDTNKTLAAGGEDRCQRQEGRGQLHRPGPELHDGPYHEGLRCEVHL